MNIEKLPKISVIIPTYNRAHVIGGKIKSVLGQTYWDFKGKNWGQFLA